MDAEKTAKLSAEEFVRSVVEGTFRQTIDVATLQAVAEKVRKTLPQTERTKVPA